MADELSVSLREHMEKMLQAHDRRYEERFQSIGENVETALKAKQSNSAVVIAVIGVLINFLISGAALIVAMKKG